MGHSLGVKGAYVKPAAEALADEYVKNLESRFNAEKLKQLQELREEARTRQDDTIAKLEAEMGRLGRLVEALEAERQTRTK